MCVCMRKSDRVGSLQSGSMWGKMLAEGLILDMSERPLSSETREN